jgi:transcriptional regulator with XRE-family HTH domain
MRNIDVYSLIHRRKMTPKEFAEDTGLSLSTVNAILKDKRKMSKATIDKIKKVYDVFWQKAHVEVEVVDDPCLKRFFAPYGSLIITPTQIQTIKEMGIDIVYIQEKLAKKERKDFLNNLNEREQNS